ncbi:polysaccharide ABC transporter ATP-binding protein [Crenothrix polyspora]|uniref:Putative Teichoic-acid-transporting ATPase n=1 Tax=Crenothrix polyspora TaxID=360316 RepID=A0A1R4HCS4_9GAMM|nr:polysaccharide ABC transporter ATP-binding protein [Crenothrix polyspora]SJM94038.1 putative Teichoic-acid-transporting ATPase [Crenothrix polyspora]
MTAIKVENLGKRYIIDHQKQQGHYRYETLGGALSNCGKQAYNFLRHPFSSLDNTVEHEEFWALKEVNFEINQGDRVGIIGRNGAGKSTLLKILSRITAPTTGKITINGRVSSLLEVGTGFHPELTGRENIFLNGAILGMKRQEIRSKFDEIVAFAEVEKFLDTPVKHYSSGMYVRLAFAVAAHLEPEILIVDEVLAVGDNQFQEKCLNKMKDISGNGITLLFVSHGMQAVKAICSRAIILDKGEIFVDGSISEAIGLYLHSNNKRQLYKFVYSNCNLSIQFLTVELINSIYHEDDLKLKFSYKVEDNSIENTLLCVEIKNESDVSVFYANDEFWKDGNKRNVGTHVVTLNVPYSILAPGEYWIAFGFWEPGREPVHFPSDRIWFRKEETIITRLSTHNIFWPSITYLPYPVWERCN